MVYVTSRPRSMCVAAVGLALLGSPAPARAAPPAPEGDAPSREHARTRFQEGVRAFEEGRHKDAIDLFLEAHAIAPVPANSFNIGITYEAMGDSSSALSWFRTYLREAEAAPDRADVEARIRTHEAKLQRRGVQQLTVLSQPHGATVAVDGRPVGVTPWTGELPPGVHDVALTLRGYADGSASVELAADRARDVSVELHRKEPEPVQKAAPATATVAHGKGDRSTGGPRTSLLAWTALGVGGATLGGALVFEVMRRGAESDARAADQVDYPDAVSRMETHRDVARVLAVVGGAFAAAGATLLILDLGSGPDRDGVAVRVTCAPGLCGVTGGGALW